jgi:hypothetical protein
VWVRFDLCFSVQFGCLCARDDHDCEEEPWQKEAIVAGKKLISTIRTKERIL